uniref:Uncharacterized protein n=1 Tax=Brassica campestris TaxID=3711 RepID=M4DT18_BRACM
MAIRVLYSTTPPTSTRGAAPPTDSSSPRLRPPSELLSIFFPPPLELLSFLELPLELSISSSEASCTVQQQQRANAGREVPNAISKRYESFWSSNSTFSLYLSV